MRTRTAPLRDRPDAPFDEPRHAIALIGDLVRSRRLGSSDRSGVQRRLEGLLGDLNRRYRRAIAARFLLTLGDEFQGLLKRADVIPDIVWDIATGLGEAQVRLGIGYGSVNPPFKSVALGMDGPAFHAARQAVELARTDRRGGAVFSGFGPEDDVVLNGLARLLHGALERLSEPQLEALGLLRSGRTQTEIARALRITRQAAHERARTSGWDAFAEGERAWRAALARFDVSAQWQSETR